ncbi:MAG TPA: DUF58 domain-containing protein [Roseiflexaceae bacterium]|nr:DUF58 domain-containing protein [Roseiflexaceae bacterium]
MFHPAAIRSLVALLLLALLLRMELAALVCALLLVTAGIAWLWRRWAGARLEYSRALSQERAFPGDEVELAIRLANRKPLPLVGLTVRELVPAALELGLPPLKRDAGGRQVLERSTTLGWYEAVTWRYTLRCPARGAYRIGPAEIELGDPFGFYRATRREPQHAALIVYPRLLPLEELGLPPHRPLGELAARQLVRDPLRTVGVRDYHPDDPLKDVHWPATARAGALQTRVYEPTAAREVALFLDLDTFERYWEGIDVEQVERLISAAATLAKAGLEEGYGVGLYVNGAPAEHERLARLPPGRSPAQLVLIMETLGRLTPYSITPMPHLLRHAASDLPWGATVLLLSATATDATRAALLRLRERGRAVAWLYLGAGPPPALPGVAVRHAPPTQDWRRRTAD